MNWMRVCCLSLYGLAATFTSPLAAQSTVSQASAPLTGPAGVATTAALTTGTAVSGATQSTAATSGNPVQWPAVAYTDQVPSIQQVLGYAPGAVISSHAQMQRYFHALQTALPAQVKIIPYATSWEGRELFYVVIGNPDNMARLDSVEAGMQALADPRGLDDERARQLIDELPGSGWLSYAVHGNEISSTDAAMMTAYHLLAAQQDPQVKEILDNTLVFLDPLQNPDGRDRFVHAFRRDRGLVPDADRYSADHDEPWPGGRTNHYHFDLNRDWLALTQPETRGRVTALLRWYPLVFVDAHEMGSDSTYYFAPEAVPYNPHIAAAQREKLAWFGQNNARWFDQFGIDYFTREVFDAFYPGYGASWPLYYGAIAMTYEQASVRGLVIRRNDGYRISYAESVRNHFLTSIATLQTVARNREALLRDFYRYRQSAVEAGEKGPWRDYLFSGQPDPSAAQKLAALLVRQGVDVRRAQQAFRACGQDYPAGSYAVDLAQPSHRLIRTLLDPQVDISADFLEEQERRREKDLPDEIYDVTAWSLPLMFNLEMARCEQRAQGEFTAASGDWHRPGHVTVRSTQTANPGDTPVAYLVPWGSQAAARLLTAALREPLRVKSTDKAFSKDGFDYPAGTLILTTADNPDHLAATLERLSRDSGAEVIAVHNSWVQEGPNFGSQHVQTLHPPRIALAWDQPTGYPGQTRFVLERQYGYPVSAIRTDTLPRADLDRYQVIILPATYGSYQQTLAAAGAQRLREWAADGGTLIALGNAVEFLAAPDNKLSQLRRERAWQDEATREQSKKEQQSDDDSPGDGVPGTRLDSRDAWRAHITPLTERPDSVAGALVHATVDDDHWLTAGLPRQLNVLLRGNAIYSPLRLNQGRNVASFHNAEELVASGHLWEQNRLQLAYKPFITIEPLERGFVIAFTADPNYRAYLDGLNLAFINAVFRAPAHARVVR